MTVRSQALILGVDLDGVCADFYGRMREIAAEWFETERRRAVRWTSPSASRSGAFGTRSSTQSLHRFAVTQRELFTTTPMIPGARKYLRLLSDEGARIRIITHRLFLHYFHKLAVTQTIDWLDRSGIPYWDLCFMKQKEQVGADVYVDDSAAERGEPARTSALHHLLRQLHQQGRWPIRGRSPGPRSTPWSTSGRQATAWRHLDAASRLSARWPRGLGQGSRVVNRNGRRDSRKA